MALVIEQVESREALVGGPDEERVLRFKVWTNDPADPFPNDELSVEALVQSTVPAFYRGLIVHPYRIQHLGNGIWMADVPYRRQQIRFPGDIWLSFDTTGETVKVTQALAQQSYPVPGRPLINFRGAVGVRNHGGRWKAEGVEVPVQHFAFTVGRKFGLPDHPFTGDQGNRLQLATGKVNRDIVELNVQGLTFKFAPGELLFYGVIGGVPPNAGLNVNGQVDDVEILMRFAYAPNLVKQTIADIPDITKDGWDQVEVIYEEETDANAFKMVLAPIQVNVNTVIERAPLSNLFT